MLSGIKSASIGLIFAVALSIFKTVVSKNQQAIPIQFSNIDWISLSIAGLAFIIQMRFNINPVFIILLAGLIGGLVYLIWTNKKTMQHFASFFLLFLVF